MVECSQVGALAAMAADSSEEEDDDVDAEEEFHYEMEEDPQVYVWGVGKGIVGGFALL